MPDTTRTKAQQRAYLERRNALWCSLRLLEPGDAGVEELMLELGELTGQTRTQIEQGLGWLENESGLSKVFQNPMSEI